MSETQANSTVLSDEAHAHAVANGWRDNGDGTMSRKATKWTPVQKVKKKPKEYERARKDMMLDAEAFHDCDGT